MWPGRCGWGRVGRRRTWPCGRWPAGGGRGWWPGGATNWPGGWWRAAPAGAGGGLAPPGGAPAASGAMLVMMEAGERTFVAAPGANLHLAEADVTAALAGADAVFVSGYPLLRPATRAAALGRRTG